MTRPSTEGTRITTTLFLRGIEHVATGDYLPGDQGQIANVEVHALDGAVLNVTQDDLDAAERALAEEADGR